MFGQTGNTSFNVFTTTMENSPICQSAFDKTITTTTSFSSDATPGFSGSFTSHFSSKSKGSTTVGLYGNVTMPSAFSHPSNTQASFGGFGTTNTNTNLFGTQQNASPNLFGTNPATSAFGQTNKTGGFSFGTTSETNLIGQPQQTTQQSTPFGQPNTTTNTNLFGTTTAFGNTNTTACTIPTGTVVKFKPLITTDAISKNGISRIISTRHCCITSMKEYISKSYEELRFEDYSIGRKGPSTGLFGTPSQPSPFSNTATNNSTAGTAFENINTTTCTIPTSTVGKFTPAITTDSMSKNGISLSISGRPYCIPSMKKYKSHSYDELCFENYSVGRKGPSTGHFGTPSQPLLFSNTATGPSTAGIAFGAMSRGFPSTSQAGSTDSFGKPITAFGKRVTTATNSSAFNSTSVTNLFGTNSQTKPNDTAASTSLFATSNTNQTADTGVGSINTGQNTGLGSAFSSTQPNQSIGLFNQNKSAFNIPLTSTTGTGFTGFGQTAPNNTTSLLGNKTNAITKFGTTSTFSGTAPSTFGGNTTSNSYQNSGPSLFNSSFKSGGQSGFSFGTASVSSTGLGTTTGLSLDSGSTLLVQQKSSDLSGSIDNNEIINHPGSSETSTLGINSNILPAAGMNLLNESMTSNQAKTNNSISVHQQISALVSAPFGGSPILKNRLPADILFSFLLLLLVTYLDTIADYYLCLCLIYLI